MSEERRDQPVVKVLSVLKYPISENPVSRKSDLRLCGNGPLISQAFSSVRI